MNRRKPGNQGTNDFEDETAENFRTTQSNSEFLFAINQMRLPNEGHSIDRKPDAPVSVTPPFASGRKGSRKVERDGPVGTEDVGLRRSFFSTNTSLAEREVENREHRSREVRKQATPKFSSKSNGVMSRRSFQGSEIFGLISQAGQSYGHNEEREMRQEKGSSAARMMESKNSANIAYHENAIKSHGKHSDHDLDNENDLLLLSTEHPDSQGQDPSVAHTRSKEAKRAPYPKGAFTSLLLSRW